MTNKESLTLQDKQLTGGMTKPNARGTRADCLIQEVDSQTEIAPSASSISIVSAVCPAAGPELLMAGVSCFALHAAVMV